MVSIDREYYPFILFLVIAIAALVLFWPVMDAIIISASLAVVLMPFLDRLRTHVRPVLSAVVITALLFIVIGAGAWLMVAVLRDNTGLIVQMFSTIGSWITSPSTHLDFFGITISKTTLIAWLDRGNALFVNYWSTIASNIFLLIFKITAFFVVFFLLILHGEALRDHILCRLPGPVRAYCDKLMPVTVDTLYVIYIVQFAIAALTFFIAIPVFWLLGYGNILFYSFFAALCEVVPVLGSSVAFIIVGAYALARGDITGVLIMFILGYFVVSALPEIYIRPVLVGRRVKIHPVIMFVGLIGGLVTLGLAGFVLGPLIIVLLIHSYEIWVEERKCVGEPAGESVS